MRSLVLGDTHGRGFWKLILNTEKWDRAIFLGDYFDSFDIPSEEQQRNFKEICLFKEQHPDRVILLIGNHDTSYILGDVCSGYQYGAEHNIKHLLSTYYDLLQMAHFEGNILFTHAGVGEAWIEKQVEKYSMLHPEYTAEALATFVNDIWTYKPLSFVFTGRDEYGDDMGQTPVWIRPRSLMKDSQDIKKAGVIQVVGHTGQSQIDIKGKATGGKYFFIDTMAVREYLIIQDGQFSVGKF